MKGAASHQICFGSSGQHSSRSRLSREFVDATASILDCPDP